jgi:hypothetical protein
MNSIPLSPEELAIVATVLYSSLFDFPLTAREVANSLLLHRLDSEGVPEAFHHSRPLQELLELRDGFFFPKGRSEFVEIRQRREDRTRKLLARYRFVLKLLCTIPYTRMVGLSGSAAHLNMSHNADLDLLIICQGKRVWSIALTAVALTRLLGCRERICANYILSDQRLGIEKMDLFNANQMVHIKPLIGQNLFCRFLGASPFVLEFYPHFTIRAAPDLPRPGFVLRGLKTALEWLLLPGTGSLEEWLCKKIYRTHLLRRSQSWISPEEVNLEDDSLKLHTRSHRKRILEDFEQLLGDAIEKVRAEADQLNKSSHQ